MISLKKKLLPNTNTNVKKQKKKLLLKFNFNFKLKLQKVAGFFIDVFSKFRSKIIDLKLELVRKITDRKNRIVLFFSSKYHRILSKIKSGYTKIHDQFLYHKRNHLSFWLAIFVFLILFILSQTSVSYDIEKHSNSVSELQESLLKDKEYDLMKTRYSKALVPRVFISTLPKDFEFMEDNDVRKDTFIKFLLPLLLKVNEEIMSERTKLLSINDKVKNQKVLIKSELDFLYELASKYKTDVNELDELAKRVDKISVSLAIGQSVQETGWGTSYFLLDGNALFAEWTWTFDGMIPRARESNLNHRVRTFPTLLDSARSYALILNSSKYYWRFRNARALLRAKNAIYDGVILSETLKYYSTTPEYISLVNKIIRKNSLIDFEKSELTP